MAWSLITGFFDHHYPLLSCRDQLRFLWNRTSWPQKKKLQPLLRKLQRPQSPTNNFWKKKHPFKNSPLLNSPIFLDPVFLFKRLVKKLDPHIFWHVNFAALKQKLWCKTTSSTHAFTSCARRGSTVLKLRKRCTISPCTTRWKDSMEDGWVFLSLHLCLSEINEICWIYLPSRIPVANKGL